MPDLIMPSDDELQQIIAGPSPKQAPEDLVTPATGNGYEQLPDNKPQRIGDLTAPSPAEMSQLLAPPEDTPKAAQFKNGLFMPSDADMHLLVTGEKPQPQEPPLTSEAPTPSGEHGAIARGFLNAIRKEDPQDVAETLRTFGRVMNSDTLKSLGDTIQNYSDKATAPALKGPSTANIDMSSLKSAIDTSLTFLGEQLGSNAASFLPTALGSLAGGLAGGAVGGPVGSAVGATGGALATSYPLNFGDIRRQFREEGVDKRLGEDMADKIALAVAVPVSALDVASVETILGRGAKKALTDNIIKVILKRFGKGMAIEGSTEGIQQAIQEGATAWAANKPFFTSERGRSILDAVIGGGLVGGIAHTAVGNTYASEGKGREPTGTGFEPEEELPQPINPEEGVAEGGAPPSPPDAGVPVPLLPSGPMEEGGLGENPPIPSPPPGQEPSIGETPLPPGEITPPPEAPQAPPSRAIAPPVEDAVKQQIAETTTPPATVQTPEDLQAFEQERIAAGRQQSGIDQAQTGIPQTFRVYTSYLQGDPIRGTGDLTLGSWDAHYVSATKRESSEPTKAEPRLVTYVNPLVIEDDVQLANALGISQKQLEQNGPDAKAAMKALMEDNQTHDGIVIRPGENSVKLREVFGSSDKIVNLNYGQNQAKFGQVTVPGKVRPLPPEPLGDEAYTKMRDALIEGSRVEVPASPFEGLSYIPPAIEVNNEAVSIGSMRKVLNMAEGLKIGTTVTTRTSDVSPSELKPGDVHVYLGYIHNSKFADAQLMSQWIHHVITNFLQKYNKTGKYIVITDPTMPPYAAMASAWSPQGNFNIIRINPNFMRKVEPETLFSVLAHEFGHTLVWDIFRSMPSTLQRAVENEYVAWYNKVKGLTLNEFITTYMPAGDTRLNGLAKEHGEEVMARLVDRIGAQHLSYLTNFHEWSAQMFSRLVGREPMPGLESNGPLAQYFKELLRVLRQFYADLRNRMQKLGGDWESSFGQYLQTIARRWELAPVHDGEFIPKDTPPESLEATNKMIEVWRDAKAPPNLITAGTKSLDKFGKVAQLVKTLIQLVEDHQNVTGLQYYLQAVRKFWSDKTQVTSAADATMKKWFKLGKEQDARLSKFLFDLTMKSMDLGRRLNPTELQQMISAAGLDQNALLVYREIDANMQQVLTTMENAAIAEVGRIFTDPMSAEYKALVTSTRNDFAKLKNMNYFPLSRFGQYAVTIRAKAPTVWMGKKYKTGDVMAFETYEREGEQKDRAASLRKQFKPTLATIEESYLEDAKFAFQGFPPSIAGMIQRELNLSNQQLQDFKKVIANLSPGQSFRKHMLRRKGVAGFSNDAKRSFASYMLHAGNHLARLINARDMDNAIEAVSQQAKLMASEGSPGGGVMVAKIHSYLLEHQAYLNNPGNEWAALRGATYLWYMGFSVKSALVNATQMMVAWSYLTSRMGTFHGTKVLGGAMMDATGGVTRQGALTPNEWSLLGRAAKEGFIDESFASDLAAVAEGGNLQRLSARNAAFATAQRGSRTLLNAASWMFHTVETYMRRATFLAAVRAAAENGLTLDQQYEAGRKAVETTMQEYARWNRPKLMRGKKSAVFIFMSFVQAMVRFAYHDPGRIRFMLLMAALGGPAAEPGAEDIIDILNLGWAAINKLLGIEGHADIKIEARKFIKEVGLDPELMMNGLAHRSFGLSYLADMVGLPVPDVDLRGSLSLGQVVPGLHELAQGAQQTIEGRPKDALTGGVTNAAGQAAGASVAMGMGLLRSLSNTTHYGEFKNWESAMPTALRNLVRGIRYQVQGMETDKTGAAIANFDTEDTKELSETYAQMLGFTPTRLTEARDLRRAQMDIREYYQNRRSVLMEQYFVARKAGDREAIADVHAAIKRFNSQVPTPQLKVLNKDLMASYKNRLSRMRDSERDQPPEKRYKQLYEQIQQNFR